MHTTIGIDGIVLIESVLEIMQDCWLVKVWQSCEVILTHQYVWIPQGRQIFFIFDF